MKNKTILASITTLGASTAIGQITHVTDSITITDGNNWYLDGAHASNGTPILGSAFVKTTANAKSFFPYSPLNNLRFADMGNETVKKLAFDQAVTAGIFNGTGDGNLIEGFLYGAMDWRNFESTTGYAAFKFDTGSGTQYGWVSITNNYGLNLVLNEWAYGDVGASIKVGQTAASPVPEPATAAAGLGLLALGAAGMQRYKRRREAELALENAAN